MNSKLSRAVFVVVFVFSSLGLGSTVDGHAGRWGDIIGPVTPTSLGIYMPTTLADVATLTSADVARIRAAAAAQFPQVQALIDQGALTPASMTSLARAAGARSASGSGGHLASLMSSHLYSDARCSIDWQGYPFSGTYVWGWGQTVANASAWVYAIGDVYQNGTHKGTWGQYTYGTIAQGSSEHFWVAWWDHPTFVNNSTHYIQNDDGTYDWGPWYCSVTHTV